MPQTFLRVGTSCKNHGLRQRHFYCFADLVLFLKSLFSRPLFARAYPSSGNGLQHLFTNSVHCLFHFGGKLSKMRSAKWAKSPKTGKNGQSPAWNVCSENDHGHRFNRGHSFNVIPNVWPRHVKFALLYKLTFCCMWLLQPTTWTIWTSIACILQRCNRVKSWKETSVKKN